jgi:hypothetical protein
MKNFDFRVKKVGELRITFLRSKYQVYTTAVVGYRMRIV